MLQEKRKHFPHTARFSWACYGKPSRLYYKPPRGVGDHATAEDFIESEEGCQQGANDGSADFAIGLQPILLGIRDRHASITVSAGHDDVQFIGKPLAVSAALRDFMESVARIGLELNTIKTKVYSMGVDTLSSKNVKQAFKNLATIVPFSEGITLMGSPIGHDDWIKSELMSVVESNRARLEALYLLDSAQHANHILLRTCVSRVTHLLRTVPPSLTVEMAARHDADIWKAFSALSGIDAPAFDDATDGSWLNKAIFARDATSEGSKWSADEIDFVADTAHSQAQLPLRAGGFALSSAVRSARIAFTSSWALCFHKKMAEDFPPFGQLFQAEEGDRIPVVSELAATWHSVSTLVAKPQCSCEAAQHNTLQCLINMATSAEEPADEADDGKPPRHFADKLQGRLWSKVQKMAAVTLKNTTAELWSKADPNSSESSLLYDGYWRLIESAGKSGSAWISARPGPEHGGKNLDMNSAAFQVNVCLRLGLPPPLKEIPDHDVCRCHPRVERVDKLGYHFIDMHCYSQGQHDRHDRIRSNLAKCAQLAGPAVHRVRTEPVGLVPGRGSRPADVLMESDSAFALEHLGQRLCVDVTAVTTLGRVRRNPVQAHGNVKHRKAGELAHVKEQEKKTKGTKLIEGTDLSYLPAAVTDLGHQGEGMVATLDHLAGCKFGPVTGADRARDAFIWRCAQLVSVGAMRGVAESYYRARRLSYNRLKPRSYNAYDSTETDFDTPAPPTAFERLRRPSQLPQGVSSVARFEPAVRPPCSSSAANLRLSTGSTHTRVPTRSAREDPGLGH